MAFGIYFRAQGIPGRMEFRDVTDENFEEFVTLEVNPEQKNSFYFKRADPNLWSLAQMHIHKGANILAIYHEGTMVGGMFYNPGSGDEDAWLTRFMIDKRYQKRGYGRQAMLMLLDMVRAENPNAKRLGLSYEPENLVAEKLYRDMGFRGTGELMGDQVVVWKEL